MPLPLPGAFTYKAPPVLYPNIGPGCRVIVQFGKRKVYTGIVSAIVDESPKNYTVKEIMDLVDERPILSPLQLGFFSWVGRYYMCPIGEVVNAALPAGLKVSSESVVSVNPEIDISGLDLTKKEQAIVNHLAGGHAKVGDINKILNIKSSHAHIKRLGEKKAIQVSEQVKDKYAPKKVARIKLNETFLEEPALNGLGNELGSKKKQLDVLLAYLKLIPVLENPGLNERGIAKSELLATGISVCSLQTLTKKGVFKEWQQIVSRLGTGGAKKATNLKLSRGQEQAKSDILKLFQAKDTVLLKGATGSGKTEIYISLIQDILENGGQVLYLLPEIALTAQIVKRLRKAFGGQFGVFHSKYPDNERVEAWEKVLKNEYRFVVGVRSSVFLPFSRLELIIVDEEHETSYKQYERAPRYHARDVAIYLAAAHRAKTLLGTATPSLESFQNALDGKYGMVKLEERFGNVELPKVEFVNLAKSRKQKKIKGNFTLALLEAIQQTLAKNKQVILFQNRRGYAPYVTCRHCGHIPKCPHCDVSLTYHSFQNFLICHYCGHKTEMAASCAQCDSKELKTVGYGTEKIEEELQALIPEAGILRMDSDTTRNKDNYQKIINKFEAKEIDVLIGTQMVSKGLDFDDVELVGIFDADRMIHFPDFRSHERAYHLIHQVSGRAGRRSVRGKVIVQTNNPEQPIFSHLKRQNYEGFFQSEITEREQFRYPPFYRIIKITVKDFDKQTAADATIFLAREIRKKLGGTRAIGPVEPLIGRIKNQFLFDITIKYEKQGLNVPAIKDFLLTSRHALVSQQLYKSVKVIFDVDPI